MKNVLIFLIMGLTLLSCKTSELLKPTRNGSRYSLKYDHNDGIVNKDNLLIYGYVKDLKTDKPLGLSQIKLDCLTTQTNDLGAYTFKVGKGEATAFLYVSSIGYYKIETEFVKLRDASSINVNFYLILDDRPILNCDGFY